MAKRVPTEKRNTKPAGRAKAAKSAKATTGKKVKSASKSVSRGSRKKAKDPDNQKKKKKLPLTTLTRKELTEFRGLLLAKRREILGDMTGMEAEAFRENGKNGDLSTMPVHMADIGTDNYEQEFTLGLLESERQLLTEITEALERIEKRTYGICLGTGEPITPGRLRAKPWARYCIDYARRLEQGLVSQSAQDAWDQQDEDDADDDDDALEEGDTDANEASDDDEAVSEEAEEDLAL